MNERTKDTDPDKRPLRLENPTLLGKVVGLGSVAAKLVGSGVDLVLNTVADIVVDAEKAFKDGLDPNIDDAKILEEREKESTRQKRPNP
jgi:hypothetical protein